VTPSIFRKRLKLETLTLADWTREVLTKLCKIRSKGVVKGSRDLLLEFCDPSISRERLKLETSNLAHELATGDLTDRMQNLVIRGREGVT